MSINKRPPIEVAADILKKKYPGALFAFVAGSFNRGEETAYSDIDLMVIVERLENAWRANRWIKGRLPGMPRRWQASDISSQIRSMICAMYEIRSKRQPSSARCTKS